MAISAPRQTKRTEELSWKLVATVAGGTVLNPLNSSMIAVALLTLRADFRVSTATVTWLISGFYLAGAVGMPIMGRLADAFGPKRIFCSGLVIVMACGAAAPFAPGIWWLIATRVLQALGTSAPYPAGLAIFRRERGGGQAPAGALGALSIAGFAFVAVGPVLGGLLVRLAGWQGIFIVNVPVTAIGLLLALRWLPADPPSPPGDRAGRETWIAVLETLDLGGVVLFSLSLASLIGFVLSLSGDKLWLLLPVSVLGFVLLGAHERRTSSPFLDLELISPRNRLAGIYAQFAAFTLVFYTVFYGVPLWYEQVRSFDPSTAGLLLLPTSIAGVALTPLAARLIGRRGPKPSLVWGSLSLLIGVGLLLLLSGSTPLLVMICVGVALGVPNSFNNLGLQAALYECAPPHKMGAAAGLFQTFRYVGAVFSTGLLGLTLGRTVTTSGLHVMTGALIVVSIVLLAASLTFRPTGNPRRAGEPSIDRSPA